MRCKATDTNAVGRCPNHVFDRNKEEAATVLAAMGLTVSDAVRLLLTKIASEKTLPFEPLAPNATTIAAMKEARAGNLPRVNTVEELAASLHAGD